MYYLRYLIEKAWALLEYLLTIRISTHPNIYLLSTKYNAKVQKKIEYSKQNNKDCGV